MRTPSASSTSAEPHLDVNDRLPCLATTAPAPAATNAAAGGILKVEPPPPPVPGGFPRWPAVGPAARLGLRNALAGAAPFSGVLAFHRNPISRAAIWAG